MSTLLSSLSRINNSVLTDHLDITNLKKDQIIVKYKVPQNQSRNFLLERDSNNCVIDKNTNKFLCRPFDGGDMFLVPGSVANEARVLRSGVFIFLYAEDGGWSYVSPTLNKEECNRIITNSGVTFPRNKCYTYCFEVRGNESFIYGSSNIKDKTKLYLFSVRNNTSGFFIDLSKNESFKDTLLCESIKLRQGVTAEAAGNATTGSWGVYVQYNSNSCGTVISPNKNKTFIFSKGNMYHMMYRILCDARSVQGVKFTDADYSEKQKSIFGKLVKGVEKLSAFHQKKLDSIKSDDTENDLLEKFANDRYVVDMWAIGKYTGVTVKPITYYSSLYPIFAPPFNFNERVEWVNQILTEFIDGELDNPEIKAWIPLSKHEQNIAKEKNYRVLKPNSASAILEKAPFIPQTVAPTVAQAPLAAVPKAVAQAPPVAQAPLAAVVPVPAVAPVAQAPLAVAAPKAVAQVPPVAPPVQHIPPKVNPRIAELQRRNAANLAAVAAATGMAPPGSAGTPSAPGTVATAGAVAAAPKGTAEPVTNLESEKRPDTNVKQNQYLAKKVTSSGKKRADLVIKRAGR